MRTSWRKTDFANHPNPEVSRIASLPTGEQEVSTASLQLQLNAEKLRQFVFKDLLSFRTHYLAQRLIEVQQEFARNPGEQGAGGGVYETEEDELAACQPDQLGIQLE